MSAAAMREQTLKNFTIHDQRRKDALIKDLQKAKERAETALLYLTVNDRSMEELDSVYQARDLIEIALMHLGGSVE